MVESVATRRNDALRTAVLNGELVEEEVRRLDGYWEVRFCSSRVEVRLAESIPPPQFPPSRLLLLLLLVERFWQVKQ